MSEIERYLLLASTGNKVAANYWRSMARRKMLEQFSDMTFLPTAHGPDEPLRIGQTGRDGFRLPVTSRPLSFTLTQQRPFNNGELFACPKKFLA